MSTAASFKGQTSNTALLIGGGVLALVGWLFVSKRASAATPAAASGAAGATSPRTGTSALSYNPVQLNASVPGVSFAPSTLQPGVLTSTLTSVPAVTSQQVGAGQAFWSTLQPVTAINSGYITFPSGSQAAAATFVNGNTAVDGNGNAYVLWGGQVYMLGTQDSAGNYPALPVGSGGATYNPVPLMSTDDTSIPNWLGL